MALAFPDVGLLFLCLVCMGSGVALAMYGWKRGIRDRRIFTYHVTHLVRGEIAYWEGVLYILFGMILIVVSVLMLLAACFDLIDFFSLSARSS
jgi:hypothetical protein